MPVEHRGPAALTQENRRSKSLLILGKVDLDTFERDGYVVVRGAVSAKVAEACRRAIWEGMGQRGIRHCDPATWPAVVEPDSLDGGVFAEAGASPASAAACDALIGPQRWTAPIRPGAAVVVRFPSQERANAGYHIEGSYDGPGGYWANLRSRARGLLALFLFSDVGPDWSAGRTCSCRHSSHRRRGRNRQGRSRRACGRLAGRSSEEWRRGEAGSGVHHERVAQVDVAGQARPVAWATGRRSTDGRHSSASVKVPASP